MQHKDTTNKKSSGWRLELGRLGESTALAWLKQNGWTIRETNWRSSRYGEIDIIAEDPLHTLVFVEIKTRFLKSIAEGFRNEGFESVSWRKRQKITHLAHAYMAARRLEAHSCRFDVIVVEYQSAAKRHEQALSAAVKPDYLTPTIRHVPEAFC